MKRFLSLLAGVAILAFAACSDDKELFTAEVEYPAGTVNDVLTVEAWYNEFPLEIKADGAWQIENNYRFLTVEPLSGNGNATVKVSVEANQGEERKVGALSILFPGHEEMNRQLFIEQKFAGDYDDNADTIGTSNKIYAVGYSYDATGEWASPNSMKVEIFDTRRLNAEGKQAVGPTQASLETSIIIGSSITEITNALAVKANVDADFGVFKTEANTSFDISNAKNTNYEYAATYVNLDVRTASFTTDLRTLCENYMTDDAWYAINGKPRVNPRTGKAKISYPSTREGLKNLVKYYGTHVIMTARLGGRVRHTMTVDISKVNSSYDLKMFAEASYSGIFIDAGSSMDEHILQSYNDNRNNISIRLDVLGGDESLAKTLGSASGFTKENLDAWVQSVSDKNMALVGFDRSSLVPLYELVDDSDQEGEDRKNAIKQYLTSKEGMASDPDFSSYDCGSITQFEVGSFDDSDANSSLVKNIFLGGQLVGHICHEYIPLIDRRNRVTVVYPVINNKPYFNMGFFIGNDTHKPARVSWEKSYCVINEYSDLDFGKAKKLYLRGASVSAAQPDSTAILKGSVQEYRMEDYDQNSYPLVKILGNIWMRQDYKGTLNNKGEPIEDIRNTYFYPHQLENFPPLGWRLPVSTEYTDINNYLQNNGTDISEMLEGGATGFCAQKRGYMTVYTPHETNTAVYMASDRRKVHMTPGGTYEVTQTGYYEGYRIPVRFMKE